MGYNTTVVILNDALGSIAKDPTFGARLAAEIKQSSFRPDTPNDVSAGGFCNAALIVETHHSSEEVTVIVGHNTGRIPAFDEAERAREQGYEAGHEAGSVKKWKALEARVAELEKALTRVRAEAADNRIAALADDALRGLVVSLSPSVSENQDQEKKQ